MKVARAVGLIAIGIPCYFGMVALCWVAWYALCAFVTWTGGTPPDFLIQQP